MSLTDPANRARNLGWSQRNCLPPPEASGRRPHAAGPFLIQIKGLLRLILNIQRTMFAVRLGRATMKRRFLGSGLRMATASALMIFGYAIPQAEAYTIPPAP